MTAKAPLGPIEIEVIRNALTAAAAEMDVTIWRTSRSTIVRELLDYSTAVFDAEGQNLAQSARIPSHLNSMTHALRTLLAEHVPAESWAEGDVVIFNDPYCGGQHLPDILAFRPVFHEERRIAFVGALCHHIDVGGLAAGSYAAKATEIFQEGLRIPPVKLIEGGRRNEGIWAMIRQNVRKPDLLLGDLSSQLASLEVGAAAVLRVARRFGAAAVIEAGARILDMSEAGMRAAIARMPDGTYEFEDFLDDDGIALGQRIPASLMSRMRAAIARMPDGTYEFEDFLDDDGIALGQRIRLHVRLKVEGETATVDLSGCSPQVAGPTNATLASTNAAVMFSLMCCADASLHMSAGCYRPITVIAPEGLVVNARHPAPVAHRIAVSHRLVNAMMGALHGAVPHLIPAAYYGNSYVTTFQTVSETGAREVLVEIEIGGSGAHPAKDGVNAYASGMHNNSNIPVEMIEAQLPLTVLRYALREGSGGAGRFRGGLGLVREWRVDSPHCFFTANMDRFDHAPYGLAGGGPAAKGALVLRREGAETPIPPKTDNLPLRRGDVVRLETSGGGGFGPPAERPAEAVARDRRMGYLG